MIYFIFGILFWQLICFITLWISNEDEDVQAYVSCGVFLLLFNCFVKFIVRPINLMANRKYNRYQFYTNKDKEPFNWVHNYYMTKKYASNFNFDANKGFYIKLLQEGKDFKSAPYKEDIIKDGEKPRGATWEYFNNWKKEED